MAGKSSPLTAREKRAWSRKLLDAQEAVESAQEARSKVMAEAFAAGISYAVIENATGLGPLTVRNGIRDARGTREDQ